MKKLLTLSKDLLRNKTQPKTLEILLSKKKEEKKVTADAMDFNVPVIFSIQHKI